LSTLVIETDILYDENYEEVLYNWHFWVRKINNSRRAPKLFAFIAALHRTERYAVFFAARLKNSKRWLNYGDRYENNNDILMKVIMIDIKPIDWPNIYIEPISRNGFKYKHRHDGEIIFVSTQYYKLGRCLWQLYQPIKENARECIIKDNESNKDRH